MKILEIVFGNSCYMTMKNSSLRSNDILLCNLLLNVGDLSKVEEYKIDLPDELCNEIGNYSFEKEIPVTLSHHSKSASEETKKRLLANSIKTICQRIDILPHTARSLFFLPSRRLRLGQA